MAGSSASDRQVHIVHRLLRARDWQDRSEFAQLCDWWRSGGHGVCALVGIGGAGKTAIAERFLQVLPGAYPEHPKVSKLQDLAAPERLFVFSFYDVPNPDSFFAELGGWLVGQAVPDETDQSDETRQLRQAQPDLQRTASYHRMLDNLPAVGSCLLVLDGLEKVQDDGSRGGAIGQINDGRLKDFVLRVTDALLPVSLLVTSRFRLYDPLAERADYYRQINVEKLDPKAAVRLLRDRGVKCGTDDQLERIAREQGFHALSVDLVGGYIAYFCAGDPAKFAPLPKEGLGAIDEADAKLDPQVAAIREQERKFARLAQRYHESLSASDPAALALLQRVCLFRLGVDADLLAAIFTGEDKVEISGRSLAQLNETQVGAKLELLKEMRLLEASQSPSPSTVYTIHPAVRDSFLNGLDAETARRGHQAASVGLEKLLRSQRRTGRRHLGSRGSAASYFAALTGRPGDQYRFNLSTLDLLEEIAYHTLKAGFVARAWELYQKRMGAAGNLNWRLGLFDQGERICELFARQASETLPEHARREILRQLALYLKNLGRLAEGIQVQLRHSEMVLRANDWPMACDGQLNLVDLYLRAGRLNAALSAAQMSLELADRSAPARYRRASHAHRAFIRALRGDVRGAAADFRTALELQHEEEQDRTRTLWTRRGVWHASLLMRLGRVLEAGRVTEKNLVSINVQGGRWPDDVCRCNLLLADLGRERGDLLGARQFLGKGHDWALAHDAKELLCWSALVRASIELTDAVRSVLGHVPESGHVHSFPTTQTPCPTREFAGTTLDLGLARDALEQGLRIARGSGFGIYHIDLLLLRAKLALHEGRADNALCDLTVALDEGVHPSPESGLPTLLAATDAECGYAWGIAAGRHLLGEAKLLKAAQLLGQSHCAPARFNRLPDVVRNLIEEARKELEGSIELWRRLKDPESDATINPNGQEAQRVLDDLDGGVLTNYPLEPIELDRNVDRAIEQSAPEDKVERGLMAKKHVFISYCHENRTEVSQLVADLEGAGEAVWWDQKLLPGQNLKREVRKAIEDAYAVVVCLSAELAARNRTGVYPEIRDAIEILRQYAPGSIYLVPVRLSDCEVPDLEISGTETLKSLLYIDLFPAQNRQTGLDRIVQSLRNAPEHP
jgi:hypothetical protein